MAKTTKKKAAEPVAATEVPGAGTPAAPAPEAAAENPKVAKRAEALEADEKTAVGLSRFECPRCKTANPEPNIIGTPHRRAVRGFRDGVEYSLQTRTQVLCAGCGGLFIQVDFR